MRSIHVTRERTILVLILVLERTLHRQTWTSSPGRRGSRPKDCSLSLEQTYHKPFGSALERSTMFDTEALDLRVVPPTRHCGRHAHATTLLLHVPCLQSAPASFQRTSTVAEDVGACPASHFSSRPRRPMQSRRVFCAGAARDDHNEGMLCSSPLPRNGLDGPQTRRELHYVSSSLLDVEMHARSLPLCMDAVCLCRCGSGNVF